MGLFERLDDLKKKKAKVQKVLITVSSTQQEFNKRNYHYEGEELNWNESEQTSNHNILTDY